MKQIIPILLFLLAAAICYHLFFPNVIIDTQIEYIKGDTITTVINQKKFDSLTYHFKAELNKIKKSKTVFLKSKFDTVTIHDTTYIYYSSKFNLGDSILGTSGKVTFDFDEFTFDSISYRYPEKLTHTTDTLKLINTIQQTFYLDEWFYSSVALFLLLLNVLSS